MGGTSRFVFVMPAGAIVTLCLFGLMVALVGVESLPIQPEPEERIIVVSTDPPSEQRRLREMVEPNPVLTPPSIPALQVRGVEPAPFHEGVSISSVSFDSRVEMEPMTVGMIRTASTPIVRVPPIYPRREQERGIEGACHVSYDITAGGQPVNIYASRCDSPGFARAAEVAVSRWRHEPSESPDTDTIVMAGVTTELLFVLD